MGRLRVRLIFASCSGSKIMLSAFADAEHSAVPVVRSAKVIADSEGEVVVDGKRRAGTGYKEYAAAVVSTMRNERRGFARDRQVVSNRLSDVGGSEEDSGDSCVDASVATNDASFEGDKNSPNGRFRRR